MSPSAADLRSVLVASVSGTLLFAGMLTAPLAAIPVSYVGLSAGFHAALATAALTFVAAGMVVGFFPALGFAIVLLLPALLLVRLALTSRRVDGRKDRYEFYPPRRLLLVALVPSILGSMLLHYGFSDRPGGISHEIGRSLWKNQEIRDLLTSVQGVSDIESFLQTASVLLAVDMAIWPLALLVDLYAGQTLAARMGRGLRPTPALSDLRAPESLLPILLLSLLYGRFAEGWIVPLAYTIALVLSVAYFLVGLVIVHVVVRSRTAQRSVSRICVMGAFYAVVLITGWSAVPIALLGIVDHCLDCRRIVSGDGAGDA